MDAIRTAKLTKYYGRVRGISELDLTVEEGEFFGCIGPNGAGKSTAVRTLLGLLSPTGGSAQIFGMDIRRERRAILERVGYLPAESALYEGMRVGEILKLSAGLRKTDCRAEAKRLCERLQLDTERRIEELSFGNRKKVSIVCALQHCPDLLILDEPTGGLAPLMQKEFVDILGERNRMGTTIFLSSHVLSEIRRYCTRAAILRDGRIIACGSVSELSRTDTRRVHFRGDVRADGPNGLKGLDGVRDLNISADGVSFLYGGGLRELLRVLSESDITDLTITEPELEEVFLHYYEKEEDGV